MHMVYPKNFLHVYEFPKEFQDSPSLSQVLSQCFGKKFQNLWSDKRIKYQLKVKFQATNGRFRQRQLQITRVIVRFCKQNN